MIAEKHPCRRKVTENIVCARPFMHENASMSPKTGGVVVVCGPRVRCLTASLKWGRWSGRVVRDSRNIAVMSLSITRPPRREANLDVKPAEGLWPQRMLIDGKMAARA